MIFGHIENTDTRHYPAAIARALDYLRGQDLAAMAAGRYQDDATGWVVQVLDLQTSPGHENFPEAHRRHLDVQFLVSGSELIGVATAQADLPVQQPYDEARDIVFYQDAPHESQLLMQPGNFAVFYPQDIHRPNGMLETPQAIRKVVVKIPVADLA